MSTKLAYIGIAVYIVIAFIIALLSRKGEKQNTMVSYFLGNRKLGGFVSALSYSATTYSAFMLVGLAGLTYKGGVGALGFELIYLMGVSLVTFFGPRFWFAGQKYGYITPSEMLGDRYNNRHVAVIAALASCLFLIPYSAVQLSGIGYLLQGITNDAVPYTTGVIIATVMAIIFSYIAGIRSVAWTDSLQALFMIVSSTLVVIIAVQHFGGFTSFFESIETTRPKLLTVPGNGFFSLATFIGMTLPWVFFSLSNPQVSQRMFMPKSLKSMRTMIMGFMIFGLIYTLVAVIWGYTAVLQFPELESPDLATPMLLSSGIIPPVLAVIVMVGIMAAAISTIDSILLTLSSLFAKDVYANVKKDAPDRIQLMVGKIVIPIIAVLAYLFALTEIDLIAMLSVASAAGLLVLVPATIGTFFWKRGTASGAISSIIGGGIIVILLEFVPELRPFGLAASIWGFLASTLLFIFVSIFTKAPVEKAEEFLTYVNGEMKKLYRK